MFSKLAPLIFLGTPYIVSYRLSVTCSEKTPVDVCKLISSSFESRCRNIGDKLLHCEMVVVANWSASIAVCLLLTYCS